MSAISTFTSRFEKFSGTRRGLLNAALRYRLGAFALLCGIFSLIFLAGWIPSDFVNAGLFVVIVAALAVTFARYVRRRERFRNHLHEAFLMENLAGGLNSRLISAFDFAKHERPSPLMQVVIDQAQDDLKLDLESRLDRTLHNRYRKHFAGLLVIFLVLGLTPWFGFGKLARNFGWSFFGVTEYFFPLVYTIEPEAGKRHVHKLGEEVDVSIKFSQSSLRARLFGVYRQVTLVEDFGGQTSEQVLPVNPADGKAGVRLKGSAEASHSLRFRFGERTSDHVLVVFASAPMLENMQSELMYPAYTRSLPKSLEGIQDRFFGLPNTKITLGFTFSKELRSAIFTWDNGEELPLDVTGRFASTTIVHSQTRTASLQVSDENGWGMEAPFIINFEVQPDEKPQVYLPRSLKNDMPTLAEGLKLFSFGARLEDDYGVSRCLLKWTKTTVSNPTKVLEKGEVERLISPPRRKAMMAFEKCFENLAVQPGDKINFSVEVYDNRSPGPQMSSSPTRSLFVYQAGLEDLRIASLGFGSGMIMRTRISQSRRATSVKEPGALKTVEQVRNEFEAAIETPTKAPVIPGSYAQPVKDYFRLMSTAVERDGEKEQAP